MLILHPQPACLNQDQACFTMSCLVEFHVIKTKDSFALSIFYVCVKESPD